MKTVSEQENIRIEVEEMVNQIPWVQNLDVYFTFNGHGGCGFTTTSPIGQGFSMTEGMFSWLSGYASGIYDYKLKEKNARSSTHKVPKVRKTVSRV